MGLASYHWEEGHWHLAHNIKNQVCYSHGYASALDWASHSALKVIAFM